MFFNAFQLMMRMLVFVSLKTRLTALNIQITIMYKRVQNMHKTYQSFVTSEIKSNSQQLSDHKW